MTLSPQVNWLFAAAAARLVQQPCMALVRPWSSELPSLMINRQASKGLSQIFKIRETKTNLRLRQEKSAKALDHHSSAIPLEPDKPPYFTRTMLMIRITCDANHQHQQSFVSSVRAESSQASCGDMATKSHRKLPSTVDTSRFRDSRCQAQRTF